MGNAGRVLMIPKGDYNPATPYEMLDCVYYNGRSYVCKQASTGHAPTDIMYWQPMTPDSSAEIQALTNEVRGNWATGGINVFDKSIMSDVVGDATYKNIVLKPNTTYTASTTLPKNNNNSANFFAYNSSGSPATNINGLWDGQTRTITTNNDGIITIMYRTTDFTDTSAAWFLNHEFQIEVGSIATPYQPYAKTNVELTQALGGFELAIYEGTAPADSTNYKTESINTALGFTPSYFTIISAERYHSANHLWYQMSNDQSASDYVIRAAVDNGIDYRVKISDVITYTKYRIVILYKR